MNPGAAAVALMKQRVTRGCLCLQELETGVVDLLIPSPNATAEVGYNRDR